MPEIATPFEAALTLERRADGRFGAEIDGAWGGPVAPNGGVLAALAVRAVEAELGPDAPPVRTVSVQYLDAPAHGPAEIAVDVLRRGTRVSACEVRLRQGERIPVQASIVCSAPREGLFESSRVAPQSPPPEAVAPLELDEAPGTPPMFQRLEYRPTSGSIFAGAEESVSGGWLAFRDDPAPLDAARLCALCDLWWPAVYARLRRPAAVPTIQLTVLLRSTLTPARGPVQIRLESRTAREGHIEESVELWDGGGRLLAESRQLSLLIGLG